MADGSARGRSGVSVLVLVVLALVGVAAVLDGGPAAATARPPTGKVAFVEVGTTGVGWIALRPGSASSVLIGLRDPAVVEDPGFRLEVFLGDPAGSMGITTVERRSGQLTGSARRQSQSESVTAADPSPVYSPDGVIELSPPLPDGEGPAVLWAELRQGRGGATVTRSPVFPWPDLADIHRRSVQVPTFFFADATADRPVAAGTGPTLAIGPAGITMDFEESAPTFVAGKPVASVVDVVALRPNGSAQTEAPFELWIDETARTVSLHAAGRAEPLEIPTSTVAPNATRKPRDPSRPTVGTRPPGPLTTLGIPGQLTKGTHVELPLDPFLPLLGGPLGPDAVYGAGRRVTLGDGTVIVTDGVDVPIGDLTVATDGTLAPPGTRDPAVVQAEEQAKAAAAGAKRSGRRVLLVIVPVAALVIGFFVWRAVSGSRAFEERRVARRSRRRGPRRDADADHGAG